MVLVAVSNFTANSCNAMSRMFSFKREELRTSLYVLASSVISPKGAFNHP